MFSAPTVYRSGSRTVEVLAGESHSAAWAYVTGSGPEPVSYPCAQSAGGGRVRRRDHASRHRRAHARRVPALTP
jgi:hypothetical protein